MFINIREERSDDIAAIREVNRLAFGQDQESNIVDALRTEVRTAAGREETPSACCIDSQTVKTTEAGGQRGYDAGKKVNGRKRHIIVDTLGLILAVVVHPASVQDYDGAVPVLGGSALGFTAADRVKARTLAGIPDSLRAKLLGEKMERE